jgi:class 3 adenylate cyclase/predicted ATPase
MGSMSGIGQWLEGLGLGQYAEAFEAHDVDMGLLPQIDDQALKDIGVASTGHRLRIRSAIAALDSAAVARPSKPDSTTAQQPTVAPAERRQLTVMFCDLVGSTALSQRLDPEALRELLRGYQQACGAVIDKYAGHVAQYLGDGLMIYFGWPRAHEDDAERAVRAGLEIVEAVKQVAAPELLQVRIGIATGPVVVGETGAGDASVPKVAVGETPNLAARLQGLAQADQIVIGSSTHRLLGEAFEYEDLGEHTLKGVVEAVRAWRVQGVKHAEGRFEARHAGQLTPFVGREEELALLVRRWQQAKEGEGQVVLLCGEPGIGKSRILRALRERLESEGAQSLRFQCSPYYVNSALWPSIDNLERALNFGRNESVESKLDKLEALIVGRRGRPLSDVRFVASILSIPCEARYGALSITPQKHKDETIRTLVDLTVAAARMHPSVMLFEDLHWADPTTLEVMDALVDRARQVPLLVVLTHRPEFQPRWTQHGHASGLNLAKLSRAESAALVSRVTGGKVLPAGLLEQILERTDGVPLFVEELTKSILESGALKEAGDRYEHEASATSVPIPATLRDSLMARLDRVMPVKQIAQIGAAIGREFSYELVAAVAPMSEAQLLDGLERLTESGLAFRRGSVPEASYTFKHALVQDAAYDSLLKSRRKELHDRIARVLEERFPSTVDAEPELLAYHFTEAAQTELAVGYWCKAGELELKHIAPTEAISHLTRGLELIATLPPSGKRDGRELDLRVPLGTAWMALRGWHAHEVASTLTPALELATSLHRREALLPVLAGLWVNRMTQGRNAESLQFAERMLTQADRGGDSTLRLVGHMAAMASHWWVGNFLIAKQHSERVLELYDPEAHRLIAELVNHDPKTLVHLYSAASAWMLGYPDTAVHEMEAMEAHARRRNHPFDRLVALTFGALPFHYRGNIGEFRGRLDAAREIAREQGLAFFGDVYAPWLGGFALGQEGRHLEAVEALSTGIQTWTELGLLGLLPYAKRLLADSLAAMGALDQAIEVLDASLEQIARTGWEERVHLAEVLRVRGVVLEQLGKPQEAERDLRNAIEVARSQRAKSWELRAALSLARLWSKQGKRGEAHELLAPVYAWFTEGFGTKDLAEARALLDRLG